LARPESLAKVVSFQKKHKRQNIKNLKNWNWRKITPIIVFVLSLDNDDLAHFECSKSTRMKMKIKRPSMCSINFNFFFPLEQNSNKVQGGIRWVKNVKLLYCAQLDKLTS
jgi:hypothetical protein